MNFKIGQLINHESLRKPRNIRQMRKDKNGEFWIGVGAKTIGWIKASDCVRAGAKYEN